MKNKTSLFLISFMTCLAAYGQRNPAVDEVQSRISVRLLEGDNASAVLGYNELMAKDPENSSEFCYQKGLCYYRMHMDSASREAFLLGLSQNKPYAGNNFGMGLLLMNANPEEALRYLKKTEASFKDSLSYWQSSSNPNGSGKRQILANAYHDMGLVFLQKGISDSAQYYLFKAMDLNPKADVHFLGTAYFYYKSNNFEKAYWFAKIALEMDRYESRSALLMGLALEKQGKLSKAIASVKEHIAAQEGTLNSWKRNEAGTNTAKTQGYKQTQELLSDFYVVLACLHYKKNEKDLSTMAYQRAVRLNPSGYSGISNDARFKAFADEFMLSELRPPAAPKDYLPVYRNLFQVKETIPVNEKH